MGADYAIVFDGGSKGNPGPGYGSYRLRTAGGDWEPAVRLDFGKRVTNNEAEYQALIGALDALWARLGDPPGGSLAVQGDSQLVINQLKGDWKVRAGNLKPLYRRARELLDGFDDVRWQWHRRGRSVDLLGH